MIIPMILSRKHRNRPTTRDEGLLGFPLASRSALLAGLAFLALPGAASAQAPRVPPPPPAASRPAPPGETVTLKLDRPRLADAVLALHAATGVSFIADAYVDDLIVGGIDLEKVSVDSAIGSTAGLFGRSVFSVGRVVLLRDRQWVRRLDFDARILRLFPNRWEEKTGGSRAPGGAPLRVTEPAEPEGAPPTAPAFRLSVRRFSLEARERPAGEIADAVARASGWRLQLSRQERGRRLTVTLRNVTGGEAVAALAEFLNRTGAVTLGQTADQRAAEAVQEEELSGLAGVKAMARALKPELFRLMTEAQRAEVAAGGQVALRMGSLPPGLRERVYAYARADHATLKSPIASEVDWSRIAEFKIVVTNYALLGVHALRQNGSGLGF